MVKLRKSGKRILYVLHKKTNCKITDFSFCGLNGGGSRGKVGKHAAFKILYRLEEKGLIGITNYPDGNIYWLTDEGEKVAKPIVKEIDEYKEW